MRTNIFIGMLVALTVLFNVTAYGNVHDDNPSSDKINPTESLYGEWWLVGWNDKGVWLEIDTNYVSHRHMSIEIPQEGAVTAYSMVNEIWFGELTVNGNELLFSAGGVQTEVGCDIMENLFFENYICKIKSYQLEGNLLRLYYTDEDYFVFTKDFDDSEEHFHEWKNGPVDPFIGEVTAVTDDEVEVVIIHSPSYVLFYSRTAPPMGNHEICHFAASELTGQSFEIGEKVAFRIVQFKNLKVEMGRRVFQLRVEPCKGAERITSRTGTMHNDKRMGWMIIDDEENERQGGIYYYPLTLAEEFLKEGQPVVVSGELYPTWMMPWDLQGNPNCYYLDIDAIELFESDDFVTSVPDVASVNLHDSTTLRSMATTTKEDSSGNYDLQGRKQTSKPTRGIYILRGQKMFVK